ncbi:YihY/virulence factor BrkB family protein [Clavibacter sp. km1a]|uniref:YihY/virulence factor BrkB family protein n=1 Tax=Clavibacter sp. km1a TaxID=3459136 RepID=UPI004042E461
MAERDTAGTIEDRPHEDDGRKPDSPTEIEKPSWKYVLRKTMREFGSDQCTDIAASLTYYAVLSLFPALIAIISLLGVFGQGQSTVDAVIEVVRPLAPDAVGILQPVIEGFVNSPAAGFALVSGIVLAIWSASGYVGAFSRAMNRIYEIPEGRPFWKLKPTQLAVTVIGIVILLVCALIIAISGPVTEAIGEALGLGATVQLVWSIAKWPVLALLMILLLGILYYATPNAKQPKFRWMSLGAALALLVLVVASVAFAFYVTTFSNYAKSYGSLAGVVVFLLWLWIANLALLFGAEFDAELERGRQLQAGIAAEETIQLPPRDTKVSDKKAAAEREDVKLGRGIREQHDREERLGERDDA